MKRIAERSNSGTQIGLLRPLLGCILLIACLASCKKDSVNNPADPIVSPTTGTRTQFTLDSIFLYAKQMYLWNDILPSYASFDPRSRYAGYSSDLSAFQMELFDIAQLKIDPLTQLPYENPVLSGKAKYSYLESGTVAAGGSVAAIVSTSAETNPVLATAVFRTGNLDVAYIALSSFPALSASQAGLDAAFSSFTSAGLTDLIIDLRSNGGGYVETASYVADLVIPPAFNGQVAYKEQFNSQMQSGNATILRHQPYLDGNGNTVTYQGRPATMADVDYSISANTYTFSKKGSLQGIKNVYFIVSGRTASASELLINCLKPYLNVRLIGSATYGKPVGFIGITIDQYAVYMSNFLITNASGSADYFSGMPVDIAVTPDGLHELGDPEETCLKVALDYIKTGKIPASGTITVNGLKSAVLATKSAAKAPVMIEHRFKLKK